MLLKVLGCGAHVSDYALGPPLRGLVHSVFSGAANLALASGYVLSLNACATDSALISGDVQDSGSPLLPNGIVLGTRAGEFPFHLLRAQMSVGIGGGRLWIEALDLSLDLSTCPRWDSQVYQCTDLNVPLLKTSGDFLTSFCTDHRPFGALDLFAIEDEPDFLELAERFCGRGAGLTPGGDDFLLGWLATGRLLYGVQPAFVALGRSVIELARKRTHLLSLCWLTEAASGRVVQALKVLLDALTVPDRTTLELRAGLVMASGATSGFETLQGVIHAIKQYPYDFS